MLDDLWMQVKAACKDYGPVISAVVSLLLLLVGYALQRRARRIASLMAWKTYRDDVRKYAEEVIDVLSSLEGLCEANPEILKQEFWNQRSELMSKVSALRDRGRLLLPNLDPHLYGQRKSRAFQGYRPPALDCLAGAFWIASSIDFRKQGNNTKPTILPDPIPPDAIQLQSIWTGLKKLPDQTRIDRKGPGLGKSDPGWSSKRAIVEAKRQFVSEIQSLIFARRWISEIVAFAPTKGDSPKASWKDRLARSHRP